VIGKQLTHRRRVFQARPHHSLKRGKGCGIRTLRRVIPRVPSTATPDISSRFMPIAIPASYNSTQIRQLYKLLLIFPTGLCILRRGEGCGVLEGTNLGLNDSMAVSHCPIVRSAERVRMGIVPAMWRAQRAQMESLGHQSQVFGNLGKPCAFPGLWRFAKLCNLNRLATESFPGAVRIRPIAITEKAPPRNDPQ